MTRTQIQLPDDLYQRAKEFAADREISLAELIRNGLQSVLDAMTPPKAVVEVAELPVLDCPKSRTSTIQNGVRIPDGRVPRRREVRNDFNRCRRSLCRGESRFD